MNTDWLIFGLFNNVSQLLWLHSIACELWTGKDLESSRYGFPEGTIRIFVWRDWEKLNIKKGVYEALLNLKSTTTETKFQNYSKLEEVLKHFIQWSSFQFKIEECNKTSKS